MQTSFSDPGILPRATREEVANEQMRIAHKCQIFVMNGRFICWAFLFLACLPFCKSKIPWCLEVSKVFRRIISLYLSFSCSLLLFLAKSLFFVSLFHSFCQLFCEVQMRVWVLITVAAASGITVENAAAAAKSVIARTIQVHTFTHN